MSTPVRTPGKRGKLPAKRSGLRFLHEYAIEPLPAPRYPIDVSGGVQDFLMLGNGPDPTCTVAPGGVGDCTFAGRVHLRMAKAAVYGEHETWETSNELVKEYLAYDGGQDNGAVISDLLLSWYHSGKILAYAPVDHSSPEAVDAAMQAFGGVYVGVNLTDDADQLFGEGLPWTVADGQQPDPSDGHCIVGVKATRDGRSYVTWGAEQEATAPWSTACVTEVYVLITTEDQAAKVRMADLTADIEVLHGTGLAPVHHHHRAAPGVSATPGADVLSFFGHIRNFFEHDAGPELEALRADAGKWRTYAPELQKVVSAVAALDPAISPEVAAVVAEAARIAALIVEVVPALEVGTRV